MGWEGGGEWGSILTRLGQNLSGPLPQQLLAGAQPKVLKSQEHFRARARQNSRVGQAEGSPCRRSPALPRAPHYPYFWNPAGASPHCLPTLTLLAFACCLKGWESNPKGGQLSHWPSLGSPRSIPAIPELA